MSVDTLTHLILVYRYWILIPLCFLEGPIVAFVAGTLAAVGYFNVWVLAAVFFGRDVIMDGFYYGLGHYAGQKSFVRRMIAKVGLDEEAIEHVQRLWRRHPLSTMFFSKLSYGIASTFVALAGTVGVPLRIFFSYGMLVAVLHYGTLLFVGYYFGASFGSLPKIIENIQYAILAAAVIAVVYYFGKRSINRALVRREEEA